MAQLPSTTLYGRTLYQKLLRCGEEIRFYNVDCSSSVNNALQLFSPRNMKSDPTDVSAPFNLGNMLRADGRNVEAEAALRAATRVDSTFADAWYNLSDLLDEQGRVEAAIECLRTALRVAPDYADAMFNLALLLQRKNQYTEAADYWRRYLASDCQSEWAARARRSLKFCEMQVRLMASA